MVWSALLLPESALFRFELEELLLEEEDEFSRPLVLELSPLVIGLTAMSGTPVVGRSGRDVHRHPGAASGGRDGLRMLGNGLHPLCHGSLGGLRLLCQALGHTA